MYISLVNDVICGEIIGLEWMVFFQLSCKFPDKLNQGPASTVALPRDWDEFV
jgi:hypothetical protein